MKITKIEFKGLKIFLYHIGFLQRRLKVLLLSLCFIFTVTDSRAGPWYGIRSHLKAADLIIEVEIKNANNINITEKLFSSHKISKFHLGKYQLHVFPADSPCWFHSKSNDSIYGLLFFQLEDNGRLVQHSGVENKHGFYTSINPYYSQLKQSIIANIQQQQAIPERLLSRQFEKYCDKK